MLTSSQNRRTFLKNTAALSGLFFTAGSSIATSIHPDDLRRSRLVFRFAVASDGHYGQPETTYEQDFTSVVQHLNAEKKRRLDLCVFNGDLIHDQGQYLPAVKAHFDKLNTPYAITRGNHDRVSSDFWQQTWGVPLNHTLALKDYAFILADTSNEQGEYVCADLEWVNRMLGQYTAKKYVFIFMHITPEKWTTHGIDCPELMHKIETQSNVAAIFHGHDHDVDVIKTSSNKPYIFDGHFGGSWGVNYKGYRIVEIYKDGSLYTYQYNPLALQTVNSGKLAG